MPSPPTQAEVDAAFGSGRLSGPARTFTFWRRAGGVYGAYKVRQAQAAFLRRVAGWEPGRIKAELWAPHHEWAGEELYDMVVTLRGFYLKVAESERARVVRGVATGKQNGATSPPLFLLSPPSLHPSPFRPPHTAHLLLNLSLHTHHAQVGQFIAARSEFVPAPICRRLARLHDAVPPMPAPLARRTLEGELGGAPL
jgi:hypothetical protein